MKYDAIAAKALLLSTYYNKPKEKGDKTKTKKKTPPPIRLLVPPDPKIRKAANAIIKAWKLVGLKASIVDWSKGVNDPKSWDLAYRANRMYDPQSQLWPFLTMQDKTRVDDLRVLPQWLRVELMDMDSASDWNASAKMLLALHNHLMSESITIPLWETEEFMLIRKNVRGGKKRPVHVYQNIDQWVVEPSFRRTFSMNKTQNKRHHARHLFAVLCLLLVTVTVPSSMKELRAEEAKTPAVEKSSSEASVKKDSDKPQKVASKNKQPKKKKKAEKTEKILVNKTPIELQKYRVKFVLFASSRSLPRFASRNRKVQSIKEEMDRLYGSMWDLNLEVRRHDFSCSEKAGRSVVRSGTQSD